LDFQDIGGTLKRQISYDLTHMESKRVSIIEVENRMLISEAERVVGDDGEDLINGSKIQFNKRKKFWCARAQ
jgi:hypothetical protein